MWLSHGIGSARRADIELPVRMLIADADGYMVIHAVKTGVGGVSDRVKLVGAQYDAAKGAYTFTTDNVPPRNFIFTPATPPGTNISPVLPQPISAPVTPQHTGEVAIQHAGIITVLPQPALEEQDFHDYVIWFPADSGLEPVYVYFNVPRKGVAEAGHDYHPAPKTEDITGFINLNRSKRKTPKQGGSGKRERWIDQKGRKIYEWDSQHGELEGYRVSDGQHLGAFDYKTGTQLKPADANRNIKKYL
nr:S-type pyocin domain-containing protein [Yersinia mollaretii]